jgi:cysteine-rich repeat protein
MRVLRGIACGLLAGVICLVAPAAQAQVHCTASFHLHDTVTLGALQVSVEYPHPTSSFDGAGTSVSCSNLTPALPNFLDDDAGTLMLAWVAFGAGFTGPRDLVTCEMTTAAGIEDQDLLVTVTDASDPNADPITLPAVTVNVFCDGDTTTTVSTSTTTTTLPDSTICDIEVSLADAVEIGSLQVEVDYAAADGEFQGDGSAVQCFTRAPNTLGTYHDDENQRSVNAAMITLAGFTGPRAIFECTFLPGVALPEAGDFSFSVSDAGDSDATPIFPRPSIVVSAIDCYDPLAPTTTTTTTTTPVCGNGSLEGVEECDDGNVADGDGCNALCVEAAICGDADANLKITTTDAQRILHASVGLPAACQIDVCDTSGDGGLTVGDAQRVLRRAVGLPSPLLCD